MEEKMNDEKQKELIQLICKTFEEIRPLCDDDLIEHKVSADELIDVHYKIASLLKMTDILRTKQSTGDLVKDQFLILRYIRSATSFLKDSTDILSAYPEGLPVSGVGIPVLLGAICDAINELDLYTGGLKSYVRLGVLHKIVGQQTNAKEESKSGDS